MKVLQKVFILWGFDERYNLVYILEGIFQNTIKLFCIVLIGYLFISDVYDYSSDVLMVVQGDVLR